MSIAFRPNSSLVSSFIHPTRKCLFSITSQAISLNFPFTYAPTRVTAAENPNEPRNTKNDYELSIISALRECSANSLVPRGQQLHGHVVKSGLDRNVFINNSLISFYAKCGRIGVAKQIFDESEELDAVSCNIMLSGYVRAGYMNGARDLFDKMPGKNCISFTTMIIGLAKNDCWSEAIRAFELMRSAGVSPNEVAMGTVISAFLHVCGWKVEKGRTLHGLVLKLGLLGQVLVSTNLLHMYCLCSELSDAGFLFNEMPERNVVSWNVMLNGYAKAGFLDSARHLFDKIDDKDVVSWGTIIDGYLLVGRLIEALSLYLQMIRAGVGPNDVMIVDMISACAQASAFVEGQQFHALTIKKGFDCYDFMQTTIIHYYAACEKISSAQLQFKLGNKLHIANWNALISGLIRNGRLDEARGWFDEMPKKDVFSWSSMISGYSQNEKPELALDFFHEMVSGGFKPNEVTMVSLISAIASLGRLKEGKWAHDFVLNNSISFTDNLSAAIIDMYAKCGRISSAVEVFTQVKDKTSDVSPWNAMICGSAMHGHAELALRIFSDLQGREIRPNPITFVGVLTACCHAGLVEEGEKHFKSMKNVYKLEPSVKHYGCMVDILGRAGRLEEAEELIQSMPMDADIAIWGALLAASKTHGNVDVGERAAKSLARLEPSNGPSRVLLSNIYADAGRWNDAFSVREAMVNQRLTRSLAYSGVA